MKILNLYSGIGGNRKLWGDKHNITAVEYNQDIANIYQDYYPNDTVIVADAHQYLLEHYKEYDFIWSSPPCPTHSDIRRCGVHRGLYDVKYPDMTLYQEIILLQHFCKGLYCIENVKPYYEPLIKGLYRGRHLFWTNFYIPEYTKNKIVIHSDIIGSETVQGFNINKYDISNKRQILRNLVDPELALFIFNAAIRQEQLVMC